MNKPKKKMHWKTRQMLERKAQAKEAPAMPPTTPYPGEMTPNTPARKAFEEGRIYQKTTPPERPTKPFSTSLHIQPDGTLNFHFNFHGFTV